MTSRKNGKKKSYGPDRPTKLSRQRTYINGLLTPETFFYPFLLIDPNTQPVPSDPSSFKYPLGPAKQNATLASWRPIHPYTPTGFAAYQAEKDLWWHRALVWLQESQPAHQLGDLPRLCPTYIPSSLEKPLLVFALNIQSFPICPGELQLKADTGGEFKACSRHHPAEEARHTGRPWTEDPMEVLMRKKWHSLDFRAKKGLNRSTS